MATVKASPNFNPAADAEELEKAMKGLGTDEQAIIDILAHRDFAQRNEIAQVYKASYGKDLQQKLASEIGGKFRKSVLLSFKDKAHIDASAIYKAIAGAGTKEHVISQVVCTSTNEEILALNAAYLDILEENQKDSSQRNLEVDIVGDLSGDIKHLIVALIQGRRASDSDSADVKADCEELYKAGEAEVGTDESVFTKIFATRSFRQIRAINDVYAAAVGHDLVKMIEKETSGDYGYGLKLIAKTALNKHEAISDLLHDSMAGAGTSDDDLIRLVLSHAETDLALVSNAFLAKYGKSLGEWIQDDTSGDYKRFLLAIAAFD